MVSMGGTPDLYMPRAVCIVDNPTSTTIYTLSLHDALPISWMQSPCHPESPEKPCDSAPNLTQRVTRALPVVRSRSEEHTSELQSHVNLVCRLLLEKKNWRLRWRFSNVQRPRASPLRTSPAA